MLQQQGMTRLALFAMVVATSAAAGEPTVQPLAPSTVQPGYGVVQSVTPVQVVHRERSAAAGGSVAGNDARPAYRIAVRMPDGSVQYRDLDRPEFRPGDHVLLTNAGDVLPD